jgi:hypothetical protein
MGQYFYSQANAAQPHDTIIQSLDRQIGNDFFRSEEFLPTLDDWNRVPLVFAKKHPDPTLFRTDPNKALEKVGGRIVGEGINARIVAQGGTRLMEDLNWGNDANVDELNVNGSLGLSTCFGYNKGPNGQVMAPIIPNHILLFERTPTEQPRDPGTFVLNQETGEEETMAIKTNQGKVLSQENEEELKGIHKMAATLKNAVSGFLKKNGAAKPDDPEDVADGGADEDKEKADGSQKKESCDTQKNQAELELKEQEESDMADAKIMEELEKTKANLAVAQNQLEVLNKDRDEREFAAICNQLPPGMLSKERIENTKKLWGTDKAGLFREAFEIAKNQKPMGASGQEHTGVKTNQAPKLTVGSMSRASGEWKVQ